jgi:hypothetical protein
VVLRPEVCAKLDGVGFGAGADDIAVSDGIPLSRNLLCDGEVAGVAVVSDWTDASAWPAVPSVGSAGFDTVSWVDDWAPPEDDTVTPGATSTVSDEPLSASVVGDVVVPNVDALTVRRRRVARRVGVRPRDSRRCGDGRPHAQRDCEGSNSTHEIAVFHHPHDPPVST